MYYIDLTTTATGAITATATATAIINTATKPPLKDPLS